MLKNGKSANRNEHPIQKTEILQHKNRSQKNMENPNDPLKMNRSVQSTNDNRKTIIITENSTKTFVLLFSNQNHAAKQLQSRDIFQARCHVTQSNYSSTTNIDVCKLHNCSLTEFLFLIIDLHFMAKWRSFFKCKRGSDLLANVVSIQ